MSTNRIAEALLGLAVEVETRVREVRLRLRREAGQTSSEYLLIAGMAVGVIILVLGIISGQLQSAANTIMGRITGAVSGSGGGGGGWPI